MKNFFFSMQNFFDLKQKIIDLNERKTHRFKRSKSKKKEKTSIKAIYFGRLLDLRNGKHNQLININSDSYPLKTKSKEFFFNKSAISNFINNILAMFVIIGQGDVPLYEANLNSIQDHSSLFQLVFFFETSLAI